MYSASSRPFYADGKFARTGRSRLFDGPEPRSTGAPKRSGRPHRGKQPRRRATAALHAPEHAGDTALGGDTDRTRKGAQCAVVSRTFTPRTAGSSIDDDGDGGEFGISDQVSHAVCEPEGHVQEEQEWQQLTEQVRRLSEDLRRGATSGGSIAAQRAEGFVQHGAQDEIAQHILQPGGAGDVSVSKLVGGLYFWSMHSGQLKHAERIPPGPVVFVANHWSDGDAFFLCSMLPRRMDELCVLANGDIARKSSVTQYMMQQVEMILTDCAKGAAIAQGVDALRRGKSVIVFPQGALCSHRTRAARTPAHTGFSVLSATVQVPIVPVMLYGTHVAWPPGQNLPMPGPKIVGVVGQPISHTCVPPLSPAPAARVLEPGVTEARPPHQGGAQLRHYAKDVMASIYDMRDEARKLYKR